MNKIVTHPSLPWTLTFTPSTHTYTDQENRSYTSVTTFIASFFPPFDEQAAAARVSAKSGSLEMSIVQQWRKKAKASSEYGTRVHAYAESRLFPQPGASAVLASSAPETRAFAIIDAAIEMLSEQYEFIAAEQIIFDPLYLIAGQVDLIARNRVTGALAILDWKTCEEITDMSYSNALLPITHIRDSKLNHYALQLSLYALLLADPDYSQYPTCGEPIEMALIHIPHRGDSPIWIPLQYKRAEVIAMLDTIKITV
jgi:ATP-dependent exoDNAse (exonuclease V) beta subunit